MVAALSTCPLDATKVAPKLYQGSRPEVGWAVKPCGFDVVVLAAKEWQPPDSYFPGTRVVRALLDDSGPPMTQYEWQQAVQAAERVTHHLQRGRRVLTTCVQGRNRSGLVNALAIHMITGVKGSDLVKLIRMRRLGALQNDYFVNALRALPGT